MAIKEIIMPALGKASTKQRLPIGKLNLANRLKNTMF